MTTRRRNHGWLWLDDTKSTLKQKIERAIVKYQEKFGVRPSAIYINIKTYLAQANPELRLRGLPVVGDRGVPLHHFWLEAGGDPLQPPREREENNE